jgi:hypothetical protein
VVKPLIDQFQGCQVGLKNKHFQAAVADDFCTFASKGKGFAIVMRFSAIKVT